MASSDRAERRTTDHAVVIGGGGPTGLMLGGRAGVGGGRRRHRRATRESGCRRIASRRSPLPHHRGARPARHRRRFLAEGQVHPFVGYAGTFLDISDFPTRHNYVLALWQSRIEPILAGWVDELGVPILREREVVGFDQDDTGVDVELSGRHLAPSRVPRRVRRGTQPDPQGGRHRLPRVGPDDQLHDRRGRDGRGAGDRHAPRGRRHRSRQPGGGRKPVRGRPAREGDRTHRRAHPAGPPRGARRRLRDRLRGAQSRPGSPGSPT